MARAPKKPRSRKAKAARKPAREFGQPAPARPLFGFSPEELARQAQALVEDNAAEARRSRKAKAAQKPAREARPAKTQTRGRLVHAAPWRAEVRRRMRAAQAKLRRQKDALHRATGWESSDDAVDFLLGAIAAPREFGDAAKPAPRESSFDRRPFWWCVTTNDKTIHVTGAAGVDALGLVPLACNGRKRQIDNDLWPIAGSKLSLPQAADTAVRSGAQWCPTCFDLATVHVPKTWHSSQGPSPQNIPRAGDDEGGRKIRDAAKHASFELSAKDEAEIRQEPKAEPLFVVSTPDMTLHVTRRAGFNDLIHVPLECSSRAQQVIRGGWPVTNQRATNKALHSGAGWCPLCLALTEKAAPLQAPPLEKLQAEGQAFCARVAQIPEAPPRPADPDDFPEAGKLAVEMRALGQRMAQPATVPCRLCADPTTMTGTRLCDRCWELEWRIEDRPLIARRILKAAANIPGAVSEHDRLRDAVVDAALADWTDYYATKWRSLMEAVAALRAHRAKKGT